MTKHVRKLALTAFVALLAAFALGAALASVAAANPEPPGTALPDPGPAVGALTEAAPVNLWAADAMTLGTQYKFRIEATDPEPTGVFTISAYLKDLDPESEAPWADYPDNPVFTVDSDAEDPTIVVPSYVGGEEFMIAVTSKEGYGSYELSYELKPASTISGTVTGRLDPEAEPEPVKDITVKAFRMVGEEADPDYEWAGTAVTAADGTYTINELLADDYVVEFSDEKGTYGRQYYNGKTQRSQADKVVAVDQNGDGIDVTDIDALLQRGSSIFGRVVNNQGLGLHNVTVDVYEIDGGSVDRVADASTNSEGYFLVTGLAPGSYRVAFNDENDEYVSEFYKDATTIEDATPVDIDDAGEMVFLEEVDLARGVRIEGRVQNSFRKGLQGVQVTAYRPTDLENPVGFDTTGKSGTYGIGGLPAGDYLVRFNDGPIGPTIWVDGIEYGYTMEWYDNAVNPDEATPVNVGANQTATGINAILHTTYEPAAACVVAPGRFAVNARTGWVNAVQTLTFTTEFHPPVGALGAGALGDPEPPLVSRTHIHYTLDGGLAWMVADNDTAMVEVDGQGSHKVQYFASNQFGAEEVKTAGYVNYDSIKPKTRAYSATVKRNRNVNLRYRINDFVPGSARARAKLLIKKGKKTLRTINLGTKRANATLTCKYRASLARGKYTLLVTATDLAGNVATQRTTGTLTIR